MAGVKSWRARQAGRYLSAWALSHEDLWKRKEGSGRSPLGLICIGRYGISYIPEDVLADVATGAAFGALKYPEIAFLPTWLTTNSSGVRDPPSKK